MVAVDVVVLTYRPELSLARCIESVVREGNAHVVLAVNNDLEVVAPVLEPLLARWGTDDVRTLQLGQNLGYAAGLNQALEEVLAAPGAPLVLLLNDDAWLMPGALSQMVSAMGEAGPRTAGIVPKILLGDSDRIDSVGAAVLADGWVANRGYGDRDEGQYDRVEEVAGACFAAVLVRRDALLEVGPLWSPFFMYAEDADWCLRARLAGFGFVTCPGAVVRHDHSLSAGTLPTEWKARQIRRNSMLLVVRCFPPRHALGLTVTHIWEDLRGRPAPPGPDVRVASSFLRLLPAALRERRRIRGLLKRTAVDTQLFDDRMFAQSRRPPLSVVD
ncbi:MAG: glycosyltransferase family 2 protein [Acidimicrobiales bacterium]